MSNISGNFFNVLTSRAPDMRDRFRDLHAPEGSPLTLTPPSKPPGLWARLLAMGPVGLARASYRESKAQHAQALQRFKSELAVTFSKPIADMAVTHLKGAGSLRMDRARAAYDSAVVLNSTYQRNLRVITSQVNSMFDQAPRTNAGTDKPEPLTEQQVAELVRHTFTPTQLLRPLSLGDLAKAVQAVIRPPQQ